MKTLAGGHTVAMDLTPLGMPLNSGQPFTTLAAADAGISRQQLHRRVSEGLLRNPFRGVYVDAAAPDTVELRCDIVRLVVPDDAFICDRTAAWLHGAPNALAPNEDLETPVVSCFRPPGSTRLRNDLTTSGRRSVLSYEIVELQGLRVTTPLRTALDLGRLQRNRDLRLAGMDAMLATGSFTHEELLSEIPRFKGERGVVGLRTLAPLVDAGAESPGESALRLRWYDAGLPRPQTQVAVKRPKGWPYFIDLGLPEERFGAEYDGWAYHSSEEQVKKDKERRGWLHTTGDWVIGAFVGTNVYGRRQDADRLIREAWRQHRAKRRILT